jgi:DNA-nicking Smr family endonuclease
MIDDDAYPAVEVPIEDWIDLHTFDPKEVEFLLDDYLRECRKAGLTTVRIVHGKGKGVLKRRVQAFLQKSPLVASYGDAGVSGGGWGATVAVLNPMDPK